MLSKLKKLLRNEKGQGLAEYALLLIVMVIAVVVALGPVGDSVEDVGDSVAGTIDGKVQELQTQP